jgi:hypothetical protein
LDYDRERSVYDDWGNITYNFRQTDSLLASVANQTVSFKEFEEAPVPNVIDTIPGDYNRDGTVNNLDYSTWRSSFGQTGAGLAADGNGNGVVDAADYVLWRAALGNTVPASSAADGNGDGVINQPDYQVWRSNFGSTLPLPSFAAGAAQMELLADSADRPSRAATVSLSARSERVPALSIGAPQTLLRSNTWFDPIRLGHRSSDAGTVSYPPLAALQPVSSGNVNLVLIRSRAISDHDDTPLHSDALDVAFSEVGDPSDSADWACLGMSRVPGWYWDSLLRV